MSLSQRHLAKIKTGFPAGEVADVIAELGRISTSETMDSQGNLDNAIGAILELSKGNFVELKGLVDAAKIDFRDVIYWWYLETNRATYPMADEIKTVHEGRGGYVEFEGIRYTIDHVAEGSFCIHFPRGKARKDRQRHFEALTAFAESKSPKWSIG